MKRLLALTMGAMLLWPAAVAAGDAVEEFKKVKVELEGARREARSADGRLSRESLESFERRMKEVNDLGLVDGILEDATFYPSLYLAYLGCEKIALERDAVAVQNDLLPETLNQLSLFTEVYWDDWDLRDSDSVKKILGEIEACLVDGVARLVAFANEPTEAMFREFRFEELGGASFWQLLREVDSSEVVKLAGRVPLEAPGPDWSPSPSPTATPLQVAEIQPTPTPVAVAQVEPQATPMVVAQVTPTPVAVAQVAPTPEPVSALPGGRSDYLASAMVQSAKILGKGKQLRLILYLRDRPAVLPPGLDVRVTRESDQNVLHELRTVQARPSEDGAGLEMVISWRDDRRKGSELRDGDEISVIVEGTGVRAVYSVKVKKK
jgi:hypothetical protein